MTNFAAFLLLSFCAAQKDVPDDVENNDPSWDKTDHKNNEYLWSLKFRSKEDKFVIAQLSDIMANGIAEDYLQT